jgi:hypothetical protein
MTNPDTRSQTERNQMERDQMERTNDQTPRPEGRLSTATLANSAAPVERQPVEPQRQDRADRPALFDQREGEGFHGRWSDIQASFVDEPRRAVEQADELVAEVMQRLAHQFAQERSTLEQQWAKGGETDTEELRQALRRYRSFFDRLLSF